MAKQIAGVDLKQSIKRTPPSKIRDKWDKLNNAEHTPQGPIIAMPTAIRTTPSNNPCPAIPIAYIHFKNGHDQLPVNKLAGTDQFTAERSSYNLGSVLQICGPKTVLSILL